MTITRRASSPLPRWTTLFTETSWSPSTWATAGQHAGPVGDLEVQVEGGGDVGDDRQRARGSRARARRRLRIETTSPSTAEAVCTPPAPGPDIVTSVISGASTITALNGPSTGASGWPPVEEAGEDADADPALAPLGDAEQLQREAELLGVGEVVGLDLLDPLVGDLVEGHRGVEGEPGEDRHLRRRVGAADVVGRVGLGVAELLGAGQHLLVGGAARGHLAEDEVGGAVDDAEDLGDLGDAEALLDHPHDRDHRRRPPPRSAAARRPRGRRRRAPRRAGRAAACWR